MPQDITAAFAILEEDGRILLVSETRRLGDAVRLCWDIPGGGAEPGESLEEAMIREVREETGLVVEPLDLAFMIERFGFRSPDPTRRGRFYFFHARRVSGSIAPTDPDIHEAAFKDWSEARALCTAGLPRGVLAVGRGRPAPEVLPDGPGSARKGEAAGRAPVLTAAYPRRRSLDRRGAPCDPVRPESRAWTRGFP